MRKRKESQDVQQRLSIAKTKRLALPMSDWTKLSWPSALPYREQRQHTAGFDFQNLPSDSLPVFPAFSL